LAIYVPVVAPAVTLMPVNAALGETCHVLFNPYQLPPITLPKIVSLFDKSIHSRI
jgi:hypothetical protein